MNHPAHFPKGTLPIVPQPKPSRRFIKRPSAHITFVLDRSGSMRSIWDDVKGGYKEFIEKQQTEKGKCSFTLNVFDDKFETPVKNKPIKKVSTKLSVRPRGWTALLDAMGRSIQETKDYLKSIPKPHRPTRVLIAVQTDGQENSSKEYSSSEVKKLIKKCEKKGWEFMFFGSDLSSVKLAERVGFSGANTAYYDPKNFGETMSLNAGKVADFRGATSTTDAKKALSYSDSDRRKMSK